MTDSSTLTYLLRNLTSVQQNDYRLALDAQLKSDNHDLAVEEKLQIITYCFDKSVNSVVMQLPDVEELHSFKKCVRKYARVKMRAITYYHKDLHATEANGSSYLLKNLMIMKPLMA